MHKDVGIRVEERRCRAIQAHNTATNIVCPNFVIGDFFVVCKAVRPNHKLEFTWTMPRRVVAVPSPAVCTLEDLISQKREKVNVARLKRYCGLLDGGGVPNEVLSLANRSNAKYEVVARIVDIEKNYEGFWVQVQWEGLPEMRDYIWGLLSYMFQDIPYMVKNFLLQTEKKGLAREAAKQLTINI